MIPCRWLLARGFFRCLPRLPRATAGRLGHPGASRLSSVKTLVGTSRYSTSVFPFFFSRLDNHDFFSFIQKTPGSVSLSHSSVCFSASLTAFFRLSEVVVYSSGSDRFFRSRGTDARTPPCQCVVTLSSKGRLAQQAQQTCPPHWDNLTRQPVRLIPTLEWHSTGERHLKSTFRGFTPHYNTPHHTTLHQAQLPTQPGSRINVWSARYLGCTSGIRTRN